MSKLTLGQASSLLIAARTQLSKDPTNQSLHRAVEKLEESVKFLKLHTQRKRDKERADGST